MDQVSSDTLFPYGESAPPRNYPWYHWRRWGWNFLTLSILAHVLLGLGAGYYIVAVIHPQHKQDFAAPGAKGPNASTRALEHKVSMAKKQSSMSAPVAVKRVTTTGLSRTALPAMPAVPRTEAVMPLTAMSGMGGTGTGLGGFGNGGGGGGGGGGGFSLFGVRNRTGGSLVGRLYDLKQNKARQSTNMTNEKYEVAIKQFVNGGFNAGALSLYYQATAPLYSTEMFTPTISAAEAPKAFGVEAEVQPGLWVAVYSGKVIPPESGTYRFVGFGDDVLVVRFNGRMVLDGGYTAASGTRSPVAFRYNFNSGDWYGRQDVGGHKAGPPITVEAGRAYDLQILIGEQSGGQSAFQVMIKKDGVTYQEDGQHNLILPVFRLAGSTLPEPSGGLPPFTPDGPVWKAEKPAAVNLAQQ